MNPGSDSRDGDIYEDDSDGTSRGHEGDNVIRVRNDKSRGSRLSHDDHNPITVPNSRGTRRSRTPVNPTKVRRGSRRSTDDLGPITVSAWARMMGSKNWHRMLKFRDRDGKPHILLLKPEQEGKAALSKLLKRHGRPVPADDYAWTRMYDDIISKNPKRRVLLVERPGWHNDQFLLGVKTIGTGQEPIELGVRLGSQIARVERRGDLLDWRDNIAAVATTSSYLVFALSVGFAAPLLEITRVENGGFHFWAPSSKGKSTLQACAATIFGSGEGHGRGYSRDWNITDTAVEELGFGHCDLPLILDELQLLDANPRAAAERASKIIYSLTSGTWKTRSGRYTGELPGDLKQYRVLILSSGEDSLAEHSRAGGGRRMAGEAARVIDVPVPKQETGIFDRLPEGASGRESGLLVSALEQAGVRCCGSACRVYISKLVREVRRDRAGLKARLDSWMDEFLTKSGVDQTNGYAVRFARRFALAYAGGLLAIDYGVVPSDWCEIGFPEVLVEELDYGGEPWVPDFVFRSIRRVYRRAWRQRTELVDPLAEAVNRVVSEIRRAGVVDLTGTNSSASARQAEDARVLLIKHNGARLHAVQPDYFRSLAGPLVSPIKVAKELERRGLLIPRDNGRRTRQVPMPGSNKRKDFYWLQLPDSQSPSPNEKG